MPQLQPTRSLRQLTAGLVENPPATELAVDGLVLDSRWAGPGKLFLALPGSRLDGRDYIPQALAKGVSAVLYEADDDYCAPITETPLYGVSDLQHRVGSLAARFFGEPSESLLVIGVTGTNGKTTCAHLLAQALDRLGTRCGLLGTAGYGMPGALHDAKLTTPDAIELHGWLADLVEQGADAVCMEVSSHGLDQGRTDAVAFDIAVFTNLSRDHLDYHGDLQRYGEAKARLFDFPSLRHAIVNVDDPFGAELARHLARQERSLTLLTYGINSGDIQPERVAIDARGMRLALLGSDPRIEFHAPLIGRINVPNLLAVIAVLRALGYSPQAIADTTPGLTPPPGRMELFHGGPEQPTVVVDYAHTPDALQRALTSLREHTAGRLWAVFGCGGDRDRGKRPQMGRIAEQGADQVIVTDDNPRSEEPAAITEDISRGMRQKPQIIHDRQRAIASAIRQAAAEDVILVAGKGHETTQTVGGRVRHFSDREWVAALLGEAA